MLAFYIEMPTGGTQVRVVANIMNFPYFCLIHVEFLTSQLRSTYASSDISRMLRCFLITTLKILRKVNENKNDL